MQRLTVSILSAALLLATTFPAVGAAFGETSPFHGSQTPPAMGGGHMGPPPDGQGEPPQSADGRMGPPPGGQTTQAELKGDYVLAEGVASLHDRQFASDAEDTSAVWVKEDGRLTVTNPTVRTTGNTSSNDGSSFFGLNAAVLASKGGQITMDKGTVSSTGSGANGLFATGKGSLIVARDLDIRATGNGGHGAMTSAEGTIVLERCAIFTTRAHGAPIATDRGGGTIDAVDCRLTAQGEGSPLLYSTGVLNGTRLTGDAAISEAVVIEGKNYVTLKDCELTGHKNGAMIYQSFSGDADGFGGVLRMTGGSFTAEKGALLYVTNTDADVTLAGTAVKAASGLLAKAAPDRWGRPGSNGGRLKLRAEREDLTGDLVAETGSSIDVELIEHTTLTGKTVNAGMEIDPTSRWEVTGPSSVSILKLDGDSALERIQSNGFTVTYNAALPENSWLQGQSHALPGGGTLQPKQ